MCRPMNLLMALLVFTGLLCLISTAESFSTEQCLNAYYKAKRIVRGPRMSYDGPEGTRCSEWRGVKRRFGGNRGNRGRGFNDRANFGDIFPGFNGTFTGGNGTIVVGNATLTFNNGTLTFPNGTQIVVGGISPVNGQNPQLLSMDNLVVAENGLILVETTRIVQDALTAANLDPVNVLNTIVRPRQIIDDCPFAPLAQCDQNYPYRTADGTCNNQRSPLLGSSNTPLGRYLPAVYSDGVDLPRVNGVSGSPLPGARLISTTFHGLSTPEDRDSELTHLTSIFGFFWSYDFSDYPAFPANGDEPLDCCTADDTAICFPIEIPEDDAYFSQYERTCMPYVRTMPSPSLNCALGARQQLNLATSYIDASQIYGSNAEKQASLRTMSGGRLLTQETESLDILPTDNNTFCISDENLCFLSGDSRVNVGPLMMSLHLLFFREHNRIADILSAAHANWTDEIIFQEARRIVIAEIQHISYGEYLPKILGNEHMDTYSLRPLLNGTTQYSRNVDPNTRNSFAAASVFNSHSAVRSVVTIDGIEYALSSTFFNPDIFYEGTDAPTVVFQGLTTDMSQLIDRLMTDELTNKLVEVTPGSGWDLAARDIQTGRDHGLPTYVVWRQWCGLSVPSNFSDLSDHDNEAQNLLEQIYTDVEDIDLWSGAVSEISVEGGRVGPTFACLIGRQSQATKFGDRFWYENGGRFLFSPDQLESIRSISFSRIICDNTNIEEIQADPFLQVSSTNPLVPCDDIQPVDFCPFVREWTDFGDWSDCVDNLMTANRTCTGPLEGSCSCTEDVMEIITRPCNFNTLELAA